MEQPDVFQTALSKFATEAACGGAVRHLADLGYTLDQIMASLDYPAARSRVQRIMTEYLYEKRVLLREDPMEAVFAEQTAFVQEQDTYGRRTLRKIVVDPKSQNKMTGTPDLTTLSQSRNHAQLQPSLWRESVYDRRRDGRLTELLHKKCEKNGEENCYLSCDCILSNNDSNSQNEQELGRTIREDALCCLNSRQRQYLLGIRWESPVMYHRLDQRMREIVVKLYEADSYHGACFFLKTRERLML